MIITRSNEEQIKKDLKKKMVLLAGPRQVGKTTLAKKLFPKKDYIYLNYDSTKDRKIITKEEWEKESPIVILDEIHKMRHWKNCLKGVWDTRENEHMLMVIGPVKLDFVRKSGESLAGRYYLHRLHPLTLGN
ncbi:MAG: AAA family ATPase [Oligoflexia bacterium]|nr:AAA family ATPase [Oligoflexia bacterium]